MSFTGFVDQSSLETPREPLGNHGGTRNPQKGCKMVPQMLLEVPLVAKRWPEQPGQELGGKQADFEGPGRFQNVVKT